MESEATILNEISENLYTGKLDVTKNFYHYVAIFLKKILRPFIQISYNVKKVVLKKDTLFKHQ